MTYNKIDKKVENIIKNVEKYMNGSTPVFIRDEIWKAYIYARDAHEGQMRKS